MDLCLSKLTFVKVQQIRIVLRSMQIFDVLIFFKMKSFPWCPIIHLVWRNIVSTWQSVRTWKKLYSGLYFWLRWSTLFKRDENHEAEYLLFQDVTISITYHEWWYLKYKLITSCKDMFFSIVLILAVEGQLV